MKFIKSDPVNAVFVTDYNGSYEIICPTFFDTEHLKEVQNYLKQCLVKLTLHMSKEQHKKEQKEIKDLIIEVKNKHFNGETEVNDENIKLYVF